MLQLRAVKLLRSGQCAAIYESCQCTLLEAIQSGKLKPELLRTNDDVTPMGRKVRAHGGLLLQVPSAQQHSRQQDRYQDNSCSCDPANALTSIAAVAH